MASNDLNKWCFIGRLMAEPEMRYTPNGHPVTTVIVAVNGSYMSGEEKKETLTIYRVSAWGKQAEVMNQYAVKGQQLYIEARPNAVQDEGPQRGKPRLWKDKEGQSRADYECTITSFQFLVRPGNGNGAPAPADNGPVADDEIIAF